ncbi:hypothetical protein ACIA98_00410 [Streptomyces sp. NPDC051366]|uniref:hypothetical protein n=1 Tax=Streptomyces sp. NPDC051366 TaxID=3365652 RepID=UPI0037A69F1F
MAGVKQAWWWVGLVLGAIGVVAVLTLSNSMRDGGLPSVPTATRLPDPDQVAFRSGIVRDRNQLFDGVLSYERPARVSVGDTVEFLVTLRAASYKALTTPEPGHEVVEREFRVGGVQKAYLSEPGKDVEIKELSSPIATIAQQGDEAQWRWYLTPRKPGNYTLDLVIETYQRDSGVLLARTEPPVDIALTVTNTWSYRRSAVKEWIIGAAALLAALGVILALFRKPLTAVLARWTGKPKKQP